MTDQQDDIEDDVDSPKCKACGVPWTRHQGIIAICQQYLETVETLERVTKERDEARREVCESAQYCVDRSKEEAERRGWDCFKSDHIGGTNEMDPKP